MLATITDPPLVVTEATAYAGSGVRMLQVQGEFPPASETQGTMLIHAVVRPTDGSGAFVRYSLAGEAHEGVAAFLDDGLDAAEVVILLASGSPSPDARTSSVMPGQLELLLPGGFPGGAAEIQLTVIDEGEALLSNPMPFVAPEPAL